jgi:hypothetical protein
MKRRKLLGLWPYLPLLFPYYLLTSAAAWLAFYDLILRPYHWHKTEHGLAKTSRQATRGAGGGGESQSAVRGWIETHIPDLFCGGANRTKVFHVKHFCPIGASNLTRPQTAFPLANL